ncbi:MAG TPA: NAD-binding protein [Stellaceae bacterium]|nr:NAD-binding protein [Stellaceae bacterium]
MLKTELFKSRDAVVLALVGLAAMLIAFWGFSICSTAACHAVPLAGVGEKLLASFKLVIGGGGGYALEKGDPIQLVLAQFTVYGIVAAYGTIKVVVFNLHRDLRVALAQRKRGHTIVCGLGDMGMQVVQNLRDLKQDAVAIDLKSDSHYALTCERQGVPCLKGDAKNRQMLRLAGIARAATIVVCTGDDAENIEIALRIKQYLAQSGARRSRRLLVLVDMRSDWLFAKLVDYDRELGSAAVELRLFNNYDNAARLLVQALLPRSSTTSAATFVVIGFGTMGRDVAMHVIRAAPVPLGQTIELLALDREANERSRLLLDAVPCVADVAKLAFVAADLHADNPAAWQAVEARLRGKDLLGIAVCVHDDDASLYIALSLRTLLDRMGQSDVPIYVRLEHHRCLGQLAASIEDDGAAATRIVAFGSLEELLTPDILIADRLDALAKALHENHRASLNEKDRAQPHGRPWSELAELYKMSSRREADHIPIKLRLSGFEMEKSAAPELIDFTPAELELIAQLDHQRWLIERRLLGWRPGPVRDNTARIHPDLVAWRELSPETRAKNIIRMQGLPQILARAGFEIVRRRSTGIVSVAGT